MGFWNKHNFPTLKEQSNNLSLQTSRELSPSRPKGWPKGHKYRFRLRLDAHQGEEGGHYACSCAATQLMAGHLPNFR